MLLRHTGRNPWRVGNPDTFPTLGGVVEKGVQGAALVWLLGCSVPQAGPLARQIPSPAHFGFWAVPERPGGVPGVPHGKARGKARFRRVLETGGQKRECDRAQPRDAFVFAGLGAPT